MSQPGYGIIIHYKDGTSEKKIVSANPKIRNNIRSAYLLKPDVTRVDKYTEKDAL